MGIDAVMTLGEYRSALRADHGNLRRYLAGCRCDKCDRPAHQRFARLERDLGGWKGRRCHTPA